MSVGFIFRAPMRWLRSVYDWMLAFAEKPYAERALFGLSFAEASFFPIPPDPLLLAMGAAKPNRALRYAAITTLASILGAMLGYGIGVVLKDSVGDWLLDLYDADRHTFNKIQDWYAEHGMFALLLAAITPIPFKVFTIASGMLGYALLPFFIASAIGRSVRFFAEGLLLRLYGEPIVRWVDKWFDIVAIGFTVLLVGGFVLIKYL